MLFRSWRRVFRAAVWLLFVNSLVNAAEFTVSVDGNDSHPGTPEKPFATVERAREAIRAARKAGAIEAEPVTVTLRGGTHFLPRPFTLGAEDSGTPDHPVVYRAADGERPIISGGRAVDRFRPVTDEAVLARLAPAARPHVVAASLKEAGVDDMQGMNGAGFCVSDPRTADRVVFNASRAMRPLDNRIVPGSKTPPPPCIVCHAKLTKVLDVADLSEGFTLINKNLYL